MKKKPHLPKRVVTLLIATTVLILAIRYIVIHFEWREIGEHLAHMNWAWLLIGGSASVLAFWFVRAIRLQMLLQAMGVSIRLSRIYLLNAVYLSLSIITPFQSGEALKIEALKRHGLVDRHTGYSAFFIERVLDLVVVIALAAASLLLTSTPTIDRTLVYTLALITAVGIPLSILLLRLIPPTNRLGLLLAPLRLTLQPTVLLKQVLITAVGWIFVAMGWLACLRGLDINLDPLRATALTTVVTLVNIFSFIPGAVGVSEAGVAQFLVRYGYEPGIAQAGAIAIRMYAMIILVTGYFHLIHPQLHRISKVPEQQAQR